MNTAIKENYERLLLASLLIVLAATSIAAILMVRKIPITDFVDKGLPVEVDEVPSIEVAALGIDVENGPSSLEAFVYCRNSKCNYLINKSFQKCNWCSTSIVGVTEISDDQNRNGISDKLELSWGIKLDDADELLRDPDKDGFSTVIEHERNFSPIDSSSHPPVILRSSFAGIESKYIPFTLNDVITVKDVKGNVKVYVDARHKTRGGFYLFVGEETDWLKIVEAGEANGRKYAVLKYFEQEVRIEKGTPMQYEGWPKYIIHNQLTDEKVKVAQGDKFSLNSLAGQKEVYKLIDVKREERSLTVRDEDVDNEYVVKETPALKEPLK